MTPVDRALPLPPGDCRGTQTIEAADSLTAADVQLDRTDVDASGELELTLPANGLAVIHLTL